MSITTQKHGLHVSKIYTQNLAPFVGSEVKDSVVENRKQLAASMSTLYIGGGKAGPESIAEGFDTMESRFLPEQASGFAARVQFVLTGEGGGNWFVVIKDGKCSVEKGTGSNPDTVLTANASDYLKIVNGEMNKIIALVRGKLRVKGEMGKVRPFFKCFKKAN